MESSGRTMNSWTFEFLYTIFQWETDWFDNPLDHSTSVKSLKEILGENSPRDLNSTLLRYNSKEDYYKTIKPLMMHEFFHGLLKDTSDEDDDDNDDDDDDSDNDGDDDYINLKSRPQTITCNIIDKQVTCEGRSSTQKLLIIKMKMLYDKWPVPTEAPDDIPRQGDLVHIIYNDKKKVFGYINHMNWKQKKYTLTTKINNDYLNKELKLITVKSIKQDLRQLRALRKLPKSSLFNAIMKPNELDYTISEAEIETISSLKLKQKKLNDMQIKIVADVVKTADNTKPRICLVQGPPGTGKTTAIIAMITELFNKKSSRRIILCSPSNKAADGVLLKLLENQTALNLNIVRVGREEKMDPKVKSVSLESLADQIEGSCRKERILANSDVIVSTLTSCFSHLMPKVFGYSKISIPICIVDEAGQSSELATLIPLMLGVKTLILVGDPQQLPPTIISPLAKRKGMDTSLFARAQKCFEDRPKNPNQMLNIQYRMNDQIAAWPNYYFYDGKISNCAKNDPMPLCHYKILNHNSHQEFDKLSNKSESTLIINLLSVIINDIPELKKKKNKPSISVITPYRHQKKVISDMLKSRFSQIKKLRKIQYDELKKYDDLDKKKIIENIKKNNPPVKNKEIKKDENVNKNISSSKSSDNDETKKKKPLEEKEKKNDAKKKNIQTGGILFIETPEKIAGRIRKRLDRSKNKINSRGKVLPLCKKNIKLAIEDSLDKLSLNPTDKTDKEEKLFTAKEIRKIDIIIEKIDELSELYNQWRSVEVNTVDGFQGREQDIILMSCVRSRGLGFVANPNRLNVSLTRAKHTMILCGHFKTFRKNTMWNDLLIDAEKRGFYANINHDMKPAKLKNLIFVEGKKNN